MAPVVVVAEFRLPVAQDLKAPVPEITCAQRVQFVGKPRRMHQRDAYCAQSTQGRGQRGGLDDDRNITAAFLQPPLQGFVLGRTHDVAAAGEGKDDCVRLHRGQKRRGVVDRRRFREGACDVRVHLWNNLSVRADHTQWNSGRMYRNA
jgi:hypothetical protein